MTSSKITTLAKPEILPPEKVEVRSVPSEYPPEPDSKAATEARLVGDESLSEHSRRETFRNIFHLGMCGLVILGFMSIVAIGVALVYHLVSPVTWHFLDDAQQSHLKTILCSTLLTGAVSSFLKKNL